LSQLVWKWSESDPRTLLPTMFALDRFSHGNSPWRDYNCLTYERNSANCLIKNLLESESLPQIRNLLEMREINPATLKLSSGVENEAEDDGTETNCGSHGRTLPPGGEER
jgi:hypothetical protein